ncbi:MAG TPA: 3-phosphoshikimate 1-carboxyvinyltransferase, partial [Microbacteriaceae bacterium]
MTKNFFSAPLATGPISGKLSIPGSKSLTNREILLSAIGSGKSVLKKPLISRDSQLMLEAIRALGSEVTENKDSIEISPATLDRNATIHCGLAGTVMRFVPLLAALNTGEITFEADSEALARPLNGVFDALDQLGVEYKKGSESFPFTVIGRGGVETDEVTLDASKSSQFVSALLLVAARFERGLVITHQGESLPSIPHIEMTIKCLRDRGVKIQQQSQASWKVEPGVIESSELTIEPDLSNAGAFLAAVMVAGGELEINDWPTETTQVGKQ